MNDCLFCKIISDDIPADKVYEDDNVLAFLDIGPVNLGHTLVVPKKHYKDITEMPEEEVGVLFRAVQKIAKGVMKGADVSAFNIGVNTGGVAGQLIFHTHVHIMPRVEGDGHKHWTKKEVSKEEMTAVKERIRKALS